jgi:hypothetical protein
MPCALCPSRFFPLNEAGRGLSARFLFCWNAFYVMRDGKDKNGIPFCILHSGLSSGEIYPLKLSLLQQIGNKNNIYKAS